MKPIRWLIQSATQRGLRQTAAVGLSFVEDYLFDWRYRTDTVRRVDMKSLEFSAENKVNSSIYGATKARPFLKLMEDLKLPREATFVDFGSGKGRALMLASQARFKKVIGVEFSPELCQIARENLKKFTAKSGHGRQVEIIEGDATRFPITPDQQVFYMFNPFNAKIVGEVVRNIGQSLASHPRPAWLVYLAPVHGAAVTQTGVFRHEEARQIYGADYRIYTT